MEQRAYQKWTRGLLLGLVLVLTACAAVVYRVDPCFYYRMPRTGSLFSSENATRRRVSSATTRRTWCCLAPP